MEEVGNLSVLSKELPTRCWSPEPWLPTPLSPSLRLPREVPCWPHRHLGLLHLFQEERDGGKDGVEDRASSGGDVPIHD